MCELKFCKNAEYTNIIACIDYKTYVELAYFSLNF